VEHEIPLIVDEIQTGMGHTGEWWASDVYNVTPDIMPVSKSIGGVGLPLSVTVYNEFYDTWGPGAHSGTFRGNVPYNGRRYPRNRVHPGSGSASSCTPPWVDYTVSSKESR